MIYIVLGMHRTGTSVVSNLLHDAGIPMGEGFTGPARENPKGYWEDIAIRRLNDKVLAFSGYTVKSYDPNIPSIVWTPEHRKAAETILIQRKHLPDFGWKDPRTVLTMVFWTGVLRTLGLDARLIVTLRNPYSVIRSMRRRGNRFPRGDGLNVYAAYMERLHAHLRRSPYPFCFVQYENLRHDLAILEEFTGRKMNPDIIDPNLDRENYLKAAQ